MLENPHVLDIKHLESEGYELEVWQGYAILHNVPYLNSHKQLCRGTLACPYNPSTGPSNHIMMYSGSFPCNSAGNEITALRLDQCNIVLSGICFNNRFSNKPVINGKPIVNFSSYYEKFHHYLKVICSEAQAVFPNVSAKTYKPLLTTEDKAFVYSDTNASRANIVNINDKVSTLKIGIIGLGGTGSYVLDQVSKTPVAEIHLFDGDDLLQHNAFRAPGAVPHTVFVDHPKKVAYYQKLYSSMHRHIIPHPEYIDDENISSLTGLDFVFICMDATLAKSLIIKTLQAHAIPFIDSGIDVQISDNQLRGMVRCTFVNQNSSEDLVKNHIPLNSNEENNVYASNIQISELNSLAAILSVIRWKQHYSIYQDLNNMENLVYTTIDGALNYV